MTPHFYRRQDDNAFLGLWKHWGRGLMKLLAGGREVRLPECFRSFWASTAIEKMGLWWSKPWGKSRLQLEGLMGTSGTSSMGGLSIVWLPEGRPRGEAFAPLHWAAGGQRVERQGERDGWLKRSMHFQCIQDHLWMPWCARWSHKILVSRCIGLLLGRVWMSNSPDTVVSVVNKWSASGIHPNLFQLCLGVVELVSSSLSVASH